MTWTAFAREYRKEMFQGYGSELTKNPRMRNSGQKYFLRFLKTLAEERTITLICTCDPDAEHCHRHILKALLER